MKNEVQRVIQKRKKDIFLLIKKIKRNEINFGDLYNKEYISNLLSGIFNVTITSIELNIHFVNLINEIRTNPKEFLDYMLFLHKYISREVEEGFQKIDIFIDYYENLILEGALRAYIQNEMDAKILTDVIEWIAINNRGVVFVTNDFCDIYNHRKNIYRVILNNKLLSSFPFKIKNVYQV